MTITRDDVITWFNECGRVIAGGEMLSERDGIGLSGVTSMGIRAIADSQLLLMEVPMS